MILKRLLSFHYHKELIETLVRARFGTIATNLVAPILFSIIFIELQTTLLYGWTALQLLVFIFRLSIGHKLLVNIHIWDDTTIQRELKKYLIFLFASSFLWGIITIFVVLYTDDLHIFILISILIAIVSGAVSTVGSVFHAIFIYVITIIPLFIISLVLFGYSLLHYSAALFLLVYFFIILTSSYRNYKLLENSISQKEKIELLNQSLEEKIQRAIAKVKAKDKLLQEQSRLAQMGEMISMIAHQWRQPLSSISSSVINLQMKLLLEVDKLDDKERRDALIKYLDEKYKKINQYVQFLSTTIDDFRDFFKPDKTKKLVHLTAPIKMSLQIIEASLLSDNIEIIKDFQCDDELLLYQNEMTQVLLNILKNSQDNFLENNISNAKITISTKKDKDKYIISISDNGGGIPEDILPNIFDPYFSTKNEKNGTGIGLYMSKIMIQKHHHGILSASNTSDGAMFEIILDSKKD